jgi:hypothetical protein
MDYCLRATYRPSRALAETLAGPPIKPKTIGSRRPE